MGGRRTRPLILILLLGWAVVVGRLAQLQLVEHQVWADEASKLERSGAVLPYRRGAVLDRDGRVLVEDRGVYRLELVYRDFRRGHPLGIVAHARAALERRAVPLPEALATLDRWAIDLVRLSPAELHSFGRGGSLRVGGLRLDEAVQPFAERRSSRASDLRYYARALLDPDRDEQRALIKRERQEETRESYLELVASMRGVAPEVLLEQRRRAWRESVEGLAFLAERLEAGDDGTGARGEAALGNFVDELESWRRSVEDAAAARLFRETAGFDLGRVEPWLVQRSFDLAWLAAELGWRPERVREWCDRERDDFVRGWREQYALPRLLAELRVRNERGVDAERALDLLVSTFAESDGFVAALDGRERDWRRPGRLDVLADLPRVFDLPAVEALGPDDRLPLGDTALATRLANAPASWEDLVSLLGPLEARRATAALAADEPSSAPVEPGDLARLWEESAGSSLARHRARVQHLGAALLASLDAGFQLELERRLAALVEANGGELLRPGDDRLDRLGERARHTLRDYGSRRVRLVDEPAYDVVFLLTREPARYPGLTARSERERRRVTLPGERGLPGAELVGSVSALDPELAQRQRADTLELARLRRTVHRTPAEEARLRTLMRTLLLSSEDRGVSGVEAACDPWLRGANGYRERLGLEDVFGRGAESVYLTPVLDGADVRLTIDAELQRAAQEVINQPRRPPSELATDEDWYRAPVGAVVLARPDGRILAAASAPDALAAEQAQRDGREHAAVFDRALRAPAFQPLGSVFKPFVALHAMQVAPDRISPAFVHDCKVEPGDDWAGWGGVRCNSRWGHGPTDMARALAVSCNSYFARLADELTREDLEQIGERFGFGRPTGVVFEGAAASRALELAPEPFRWSRAADIERQVRRAANGLQVVEVTPVQVARAMAGLATGSLPSMRLVDRIGERSVPWPEPEPLPYDAERAEAVRRMLLGVTNARDGSAVATLSRSVLGVEVAAKTGSADLQHRRARGEDGQGVILKHTWVAGWLPAGDPKLVFVVFLDSTEVASGRAAIWVAGQLLGRPEVRAVLAEPYSDLGAGGAW